MKEENQTDFKLLDSSIWLEYLFKGAHKDLIENEHQLFISTLSIYEIKKILLENNINKQIIDEKLSFIKSRCITIYVDNAIAEKAATLTIENKVPAIDALIYTSALLNNAKAITIDNDFRGLNNAVVLDKN